MSAIRGLVTDTLTFSNVDGPGNRFVVFVQGCNFNCLACHNPYTINVCNSCGECVVACPSGALTVGQLGNVAFDDTVCEGSDRCLAVCPFDSSPKARVVDVDELLARMRLAAPFLSGITVSGGEPTQQAAFLHSLFSAVKADQSLAALTCFVDSNGSADPLTWDALAPVMDGAMLDLKCLDPMIHRYLTGWPNDSVLASIRQLHSMGLLYEVRLLLVAGLNDNTELLRRTAGWLAGLDSAMRVKLIGFRRHGVRPHSPALVEPTVDAMLAAADLFREVAPFDLCVV